MRNVSRSIRFINEKDNLKVKEIILTSLDEYGANKEGFAAKDPELNDLYSFYIRQNGYYLVAEIKNEIVGGAGIAPLVGDINIWELQKMYISKEYRGEGIGRKLIQECIELARNKEIKQLYLETLDSMKEANILYQKFGFKKIDSPLGNTGHFGCDRYYLLNLE